MADTDLPNGFGAIDRPSGLSRPPRPIASPFGMLPTDGLTSPPGPPPGFKYSRSSRHLIRSTGYRGSVRSSVISLHPRV
jgi:hypothetical protein